MKRIYTVVSCVIVYKYVNYPSRRRKKNICFNSDNVNKIIFSERKKDSNYE